jgi:hypothetical protein
MRDATTTDSDRSHTKENDHYARAWRASILLIGIALLAVGAFLPSREGFLAGTVCTGTAILTGKVFG